MQSYFINYMAQKEFKIAHLSDLHLSPDYFPERSELFRSLLSQCESFEVDHIVITGDITNQGKKKEFEHFREILKEYDLLNSKKLTVVIGNHDIFGGPYYAEDVVEFPAMCKTTDYDSKIKDFFNAAKETFIGSRFFSKDSFFPFVKIFGNVAFVGLNSIARWSATKNPLGSNGAIDDKQFELLKSILQSPILEHKKIFIIVHHHFHELSLKQCRSTLERLWRAIEATTMKLRKKKRLLKLFHQAGVEAILHGHVHQNDEYEHRGIKCFNAGGTIIPSHTAQQKFNLFAITEEKIELRIPPFIQHQQFNRIKLAKKSLSDISNVLVFSES